MYDYSIVPSEKIKQRMDYFYAPYNDKFLLRKHMTFSDSEEIPEEEEDLVNPQKKKQKEQENEPIMTNPCLEKMLTRL